MTFTATATNKIPLDLKSPSNPLGSQRKDSWILVKQLSTSTLYRLPEVRFLWEHVPSEPQNTSNKERPKCSQEIFDRAFPLQKVKAELRNTPVSRKAW